MMHKSPEQARYPSLPSRLYQRPAIAEGTGSSQILSIEALLCFSQACMLCAFEALDSNKLDLLRNHLL